MKTLLQFTALASLTVMLFSCKDKIEEVYTVNEPVYLTYSELRGPLKVAGGQEIVHPGKIYFKDDYVFVNEYQKGIHVVNNQSPEQPVIEKFIEIPGNVDLAIRGDILFADSYVDLVAIDISDLNDIKEVARVEDAFPYILPFCENGVVEDVDETHGVVTGWKSTERKVDIDDIHSRFEYYPQYEYDMRALVSTNSFASKTGASVSGTGGSMARFTVYGDYLYAIDQYMLRLFNISQETHPVQGKEIYVGWDIETLFPYGQNLFVGSTMGMYIYSLADPSDPTYVSMFWHATGCDPVVVEDNLAYVTLRAGNMCGNNLSQLDVIDISNLSNPKLLKEYAMEEPYGLGIDDGVLFVCEGDGGLKIYNASDPLKIDQNKIAHYTDINAWDVIPLGNVLLMIGTDGLYQYNYENLQDIKEISVIPIENLTHRE